MYAEKKRDIAKRSESFAVSRITVIADILLQKKENLLRKVNSFEDKAFGGSIALSASVRGGGKLDTAWPDSFTRERKRKTRFQKNKQERPARKETLGKDKARLVREGRASIASKGNGMKKMIKVCGISALLLGIALFASGCDKFSCSTGNCGPIETWDPCAKPVATCAPVVTTCNTCP